MKLRSWVGLLVLLSPLVLIACSNNSASSGSSGTGALYIVTQGDQMASSFSVDLGTGSLAAIGTAASTGTTPAAMAITPNGNTIFVANSGSDDISAFTVNSDGSLTAAGGSTPTGVTPLGMAIDPAGKILFVATQGIPGTTDPTMVGTITSYSISGTTLTQVSVVSTTLSGAVNARPVAVAVVALSTGNFLYAANQNDGTVSAFGYDVNGILTAAIAPPYLVGTAPSALVVTPVAAAPPNGTFLYVANSGSSNVNGFSIATDGTLTSTGVATSAGLGPASIAVSPAGKFLYVADRMQNAISSFLISPVNGVLSAAAPATTSTAIEPVWVAVHPAGSWAYVANFGSASISILSIKAGGGLGSPQKPVTTGGQPAAIALK